MIKKDRPSNLGEAIRDATANYGIEPVRRRKLKQEDFHLAHMFIREQEADYGQEDPRIQTVPPYTR